MTGGAHKQLAPEIVPAALPVPGREEEEAKKKVGRGKGRSANILAGRLMSERGGMLSNILGP